MSDELNFSLFVKKKSWLTHKHTTWTEA